MKRPTKFGLIRAAGAAALLALAAGLFFASQATAQDEAVAIGRATVVPGTDATVALEALDIGSPGLGAWEIGITYDPSVVSVRSCSAGTGSVCNPNFSSNQIRVVGALSSGRVGDTLLANITFRCGNDEDTSALTVTIVVLADATVGSPRPITADAVHGAIDCSEAAGLPERPTSERPSEAEPTATTAVGGLPPTGTGSTGGTGPLFWAFAALSASGIAAAAGTFALRRSR
jgi:hypothetical protein